MFRFSSLSFSFSLFLSLCRSVCFVSCLFLFLDAFFFVDVEGWSYSFLFLFCFFDLHLPLNVSLFHLSFPVQSCFLLYLISSLFSKFDIPASCKDCRRSSLGVDNRVRQDQTSLSDSDWELGTDKALASFDRNCMLSFPPERE